MKTVRQYFPFLMSLLLILALVEWIVAVGVIPDFIIPRPTAVLQFLMEEGPDLIATHLTMTFLETFIGFLLALVLGIGLAIAMFWSPIMEKVFYPYILISQTIPTLALSPIFILWFGYSIWSKVAIAFLIAFFPIVVGLFDGMRSSSEDAIDLFVSLGASRWERLWQLHFIAALPQLLSAVKLAIVYAVVGATIGEWIGAAQGLGYYSRRMSGNLNAEGVFASIVLISLLGMGLFLLVSLLERFLIPWHHQQSSH